MTGTIEQSYEELWQDLADGRFPTAEMGIVDRYLTQNGQQITDLQIKGWIVEQKVLAMAYYEQYLRMDALEK